MMKQSRRQFLATCAVAGVARAAGPDDAAFVQAAALYIGNLFEATPERATGEGEHRYDGQLSDPSSTGRNLLIGIHRDFMNRVKDLDPAKLQPENRVDLSIARLHAVSAVWSQTALREFEWDPTRYNPGKAIYGLLARDFAPAAVQLESVRQRLEAIPAYLEKAQSSLKNPPRIFTETAIQQNKGTISLVRNVVTELAATVPGMKDKLAPAQAEAVKALEGWGQTLETDVLSRSNRDFRLGAELFETKLRYALDSEFSGAEIEKRAQDELVIAQQAIYETAVKLARQWSPSADVSDRRSTVRMVLDRLADQRPSASDIVPKAEKVLRETTDFVRSKSLVSVPATPLQITLMPEFQRGVAVATCDSPGPYEKNGKTFLNISPPPSDWNVTQVESFFREYNDSMLKDLVAHEAMPGHYLQSAHANRFAAPTKLRAVFSSGSFAEGWAVYAERMMADAGYGGAEFRMEQLKMWLRTIINALLDTRIHTQGMTEQQAMDLMMNEGFQERSEAVGKWRRACLSSAQLSTYFTGASELLQFRADYVKRHGAISELKAFHDKMLSHGSPPPRYLKQLMS